MTERLSLPHVLTRALGTIYFFNIIRIQINVNSQNWISLPKRKTGHVYVKKIVKTHKVLMMIDIAL
jgi:hypothetical protein